MLAVVSLTAVQARAVDPVIQWNFDGDFTNSGTGGSAYDALLIDGAGGTNAFTTGVSGQALDLGHPSPAARIRCQQHD